MEHLKKFPKNPVSNEAISIADLQLWMTFNVIDGTGSTALRGVLTELPEYDGEEWHGARLFGKDGEVSLDLYGAGIICSRQGVWSESHTIMPESQEINLAQ